MPDRSSVFTSPEPLQDNGNFRVCLPCPVYTGTESGSLSPQERHNHSRDQNDRAATNPFTSSYAVLGPGKHAPAGSGHRGEDDSCIAIWCGHYHGFRQCTFIMLRDTQGKRTFRLF